IKLHKFMDHEEQILLCWQALNDPEQMPTDQDILGKAEDPIKERIYIYIKSFYDRIAEGICHKGQGNDTYESLVGLHPFAPAVIHKIQRREMLFKFLSDHTKEYLITLRWEEQL